MIVQNSRCCSAHQPARQKPIGRTMKTLSVREMVSLTPVSLNDSQSASIDTVLSCWTDLPPAAQCVHSSRALSIWVIRSRCVETIQWAGRSPFLELNATASRPNRSLAGRSALLILVPVEGPLGAGILHEAILSRHNSSLGSEFHVGRLLKT